MEEELYEERNHKKGYVCVVALKWLNSIKFALSIL